MCAQSSCEIIMARYEVTAGMVLLNECNPVLTMMAAHGNDWCGLQQALRPFSPT